MSDIELTFIRRREGIEVTARSVVKASEIGKTNEQIDDLAVTMYEAIEAVDGAGGYRQKKEGDAETTARRQGFAIRHKRALRERT